MKKTVLLCLIFAVIISLFSCHLAGNDISASGPKNKYLYLIAGFDEAAENTDVLFTLGYDSGNNTAYIAQIPRDTYFNFGSAQNKINQIYATRRLLGDDKDIAMNKTADTIAASFGVKFDGYVGITIETFKKVIDSIGGIDIELPADMTVYLDDETPLVLKAGKNHITGSEAEKFIRYRKGYITGDLGRIDAQKMFLHALFLKLSTGIPFSSMFDLFFSFSKEIITNIKISETLSLLSGATQSKADKKTFYVTIPGEAAESKNGLSFYVLNRKSVAEIAKKYMFAASEFDKDKKFLNFEDPKFINIYNDDSIDVREYSNHNVSDIKIN